MSMARWWLVPSFSLAALLASAQTGWAPVSREVELPYAQGLQRTGSGVHTAIRPYKTVDMRKAMKADSLLPRAALRELDTWAGRLNGRRFRWGPLLELNGGYETGSHSGVRYRGGAGFWTDADLGKKLQLHVDAQAWGDRLPTYLDSLAQATQVTTGEGYAHGDPSLYTHYDWSAHLSWDAHKYINLTVGRGKHFFGEGHRSLFLSDEAYSYPYLRITTELWRIKYVNLFAMMNDIRGAGGDWTRFERKFTSMHYLSWNALDRLNLALFEAVVWSAGDAPYPRGFDVNYLNPVLFFRPTEFRLGSPDNALLGFAANAKAGKYVLFYAQAMLDEFLVKQVRNGFGWYANKQALQFGVNAYRAFGVEGLHLRGEWNYIRPFMYTHSDTRQNYSHMGQPLAHPYGSNVQEALAHGDLTQGRWVFTTRASLAWMGNDSTYSYGNNIFRPERDRPPHPLGGLQDFDYEMGRYGESTLLHIEARAGWTVDPRSAMRLEAAYTFRQLTPAWGPMDQTHYFRLGLACHFRDRHPEQVVRYVFR
ncbi:MAG: hypothetical protein IT225_09335 [Flavobacteriales bacterium]|nr:hypothetical protein [Flavobacteriales bacterium]